LATEVSFLVDDTGSVQFGRTSRWVASDNVDDDALSAVRELGRIEWLVRDGHVRVRLRPSLVSHAAYARLMGWLARHQPERVLLSWFAMGEWQYEYLRSSSLAARRLRELVERHGGATSCNLRRHARPVGGRSARAIEFWREHRDNFQVEPAMDVLGRLLDDRWILYEVLPGFCGSKVRALPHRSRQEMADKARARAVAAGSR